MGESMVDNENIRISCSDCGSIIPASWAHSKNEEKCPKCGSTKQSIEIEFEDHIEIHDKLQGKVKDLNYSSKKNPRYEFIEGDDQRENDGKWMKKTRIIDKYNDKYIERITDPETGEVVHENKEPLSNHFGHGTAKFKKDKNTNCGVWGVGEKMDAEMNQVNIFTDYKQKENHFTNGLVSILKLAELEDLNFNSNFFNELLNIKNFNSINSFKVLEGYDKKSTADAILTAENTRILFETKIVSATLRVDQVNKHLADLKHTTEKYQYLVLLTPDDSNSNYIKTFQDIDKIHIKHLEWKKLYDFLINYQFESNILREIIKQYLSVIKNMIFEQDIVGIIAKISFGEKSGVYAGKYLDEMRNGEWTEWNTPRQYKSLDGTGRKLLLYDKNLRAISLEVEISGVEKTNQEADYPWTNRFVPNTLRVFRDPIPVVKIETIDSFSNFVHERAPYRNLTHEQYRQLISENNSLK